MSFVAGDRRIQDGVLAGLLVGIVAVLGGVLLPATTAYSDADLVATGLVGLTFGAAGIRYFRCGRDLLDPFVVFSASLGFYFGLHTLWMSTPANSAFVQRQIYAEFVPYIPSSLALLALSYLALLLGYAVIKPRRRTTSPPKVYGRFPLIALFVIGMGFYLLAAAHGAFNKSYQNTGLNIANLQTYETFGFLSIVALVVCSSQHYLAGAKRTPYRNLMWLMLLVELAFGFAVAQKTLAFTGLFAWAAARNYCGRRFHFKTVVAIALVALFVVTPLIQSTRTVPQAAQLGSQGTLNSVSATGASFPQHVVSYITGFPGSALQGWGILNRRVDSSESLALAVHYTPAYQGWLYGRHWLAIVAAPVPHAFWPNKPTWDPSLNFSEVYAGESPAYGYNLTYSPTLPADFYMNFGAFGIILGMFVVGAILRIVTFARGRFAGSIGVAIYVSCMLGLVLIERDTVNVGTYMLLQLIAVGVGFVLLRLLNGLLATRSA